MTVPQDIRDKANEIAVRYPIRANLVMYWLHELRLRPEVAEIFASLTQHGYAEAHVNTAAEAIERAVDGKPDAEALRDLLKACGDQQLAHRETVDQIVQNGRLWVPHHLRHFYDDIIVRIKRDTGYPEP